MVVNLENHRDLSPQGILEFAVNSENRLTISECCVSVRFMEAKYIVPIGKVEHVFEKSDLGLVRAQELARSARSKVLLEGKVWRNVPRGFVTVRREIQSWVPVVCCR